MANNEDYSFFYISITVINKAVIGFFTPNLLFSRLKAVNISKVAEQLICSIQQAKKQFFMNQILKLADVGTFLKPKLSILSTTSV